MGVVHDLIGIKESGNGQLEEHMIECVCELLQAIGYTLDATQHGKALMTQFACRLADLRRSTSDKGDAVFGARIKFKIQDLLDLRANDWQKKLFIEQAKPKDEIRKDAMREARQAARGNDVMFATQTAGMRPDYIEVFKQPSKAVKST